MRLIDADAFWNELEELRKYASPDFSPEIYRIQARIAAQPTIEPVPTESEFERIAIQRGYVHVVRCKDCKDWSRTYEQYDCCMKRRFIYTDNNYCEGENDFCSHGERKDEVSE